MPHQFRNVQANRQGLVVTHEHCPCRSYLSLEIPPDADKILAVTFETVGRDQGWADDKRQSFTWFVASLYRPPGRVHVPPPRIHSHAAGDPEFKTVKTIWDAESYDKSDPKVVQWLNEIQRGDTIQILPQAEFPGWVNIVSGASIVVKYMPGKSDRGTEITAWPVANSKFYTQKLQDASHSMIRVLAVEPGQYDDPLHGSFCYERLDDPALDFDALSYCWGTQEQRDSIGMSNGHAVESLPSTAFSISRNVALAIRGLRHKNDVLKIWIDAICINQDDLTEREHQVSLMGSIYSLAGTVHIWLGEGGCGCGAALRVIRDIYNLNSELRCQGSWQCRCTGSPHSALIELEQYVQTHNEGSWRNVDETFNFNKASFSEAEIQASTGENCQIWFLVSSLFQNPWFQRVWVLQEALAAHRALLHIGSDCINWFELDQVVQWMDEPQYRSHKTYLHLGLMMPSVWKKLSRRRREDTGHMLSLLEIFLATLDMRATDPRDRLYAIIGFSQEVRKTAEIPTALRPNYEKSLEIVMADFTRWCMMEQCSLRVLSFVHCQPSRAWNRTLSTIGSPISAFKGSPAATWALSTEGYSNWADLNLVGRFPGLKAAADSMLITDLLMEEAQRDPLVLHLRGVSVGSIELLGYPPDGMIFPLEEKPWSDSEMNPNMNAAFDHLFDPCGRHGSWSRPFERNQNRSLMPLGERTDKYRDHCRAHTSYFPDKAKILHFNQGSSVEYEMADLESLPSCADPCCFVASSGHYGLCPWTTQVGDLVVILEGGPVPYLLRRVEQTHGTQAQDPTMYHFIGECFIEDLMNGDFFTKVTLASGYEPEVFRIM
ncbi:hypothetical protein G7054_g10234 [Neopestalotiopsis clavispora]|nr:hypothetical protein G7054_g10234 [Neopestalotiopsis clavispora]